MIDGKKENILLDAQLVDVISTAAFHAELCNGHRIVAHLERKAVPHPRLTPGDRVVVRLSPYDMSRGTLVFKEETES